MFERVQDILSERSPQKVHPRTINSDYLLSGFLYCGKCGAALLGSAAKSSRFFYYACHNYTKRGKAVCDARLIRKEKLEAFVIEQLKAHVLTEENLAALVQLTNEEITRAKDGHEDRLAAVDRQIEDVEARLDKLYSALETGKLELEDLAPRIKALRSQKDDLEEKRLAVVESLKETTVELLGVPKVRAYVDDLRELLSKGSIVEQKAFLRSFIKRIEVNHPHIALDYTMPLKRTKGRTTRREVLPLLRWLRPSRRGESAQSRRCPLRQAPSGRRSERSMPCGS